MARHGSLEGNAATLPNLHLSCLAAPAIRYVDDKKLYNELPLELRKIKNCEKFEKQVKEHFK